ncbi:MAG: restriction endonuclease subunit S [Candidatus Accumulibacter sp.]|uniref:Restriction endonuclease subunit S n=1 Tax=Candidatus Accumulibacter affinis TaxID=2954384 RepID=A0A935T430_9PROT|nr:restriction endonuclease subunit S [Candidatus Accumulibacter affinis]
MEVRPGYKQTEEGVIPADWDSTNLGNFVALQRGHDLTWRDRRNGEVPVIGSAGHNGFHDVALAKGPGVVLGRSGASFGQAHYCDQNYWPHNTALYVTDFLGNDPLFVFYFLRAFDFTRHNSGGAQQSLNRNFIAPIPVGIPRPAEQRAIAAALSDADALLGGLERLIAKKRDLKQAAMQQLLTGQTRLPGFGGKWEVKRLGDLASFYKGKGLPKSVLSSYGAEPCIHYGELFTRYAETISEVLSRTDSRGLSFRSVANDVLMPTSDVTPRGLAKASCVTADGVILGGDILVIRSDTKLISGSFLSYLIRYQEEQVLQLVTGSTVFHLYSTDMKKFTFAMPPLPEQTAIARVLADMDAELSALEARRDKTRSLKQAMMQELLTGRIRLISGQLKVESGE